jgi:peptidylprolyl isomerase
MRLLAPVVFLAASVSIAVHGQTTSVIPAPLDVAAPPADAVKTASGLATKVLKPGTGRDRPAATDTVTIHYTGWTTDGKMFDSSVAKGKPAVFPVNKVIPGFSEALQLMVPGEKRRVWIPEALAYKGRADKPKGMLVFDIELINIPNQPPADVKAPPADAMKTESGIFYKILNQGIGGRHPKSSSVVSVNYTGWTTDGKMFDSSFLRGAPATFPLEQVIPGWTEGLQLMVEGEKLRMWIPENLAYKGQQAPFGMLVFDIELLEIKQ